MMLPLISGENGGSVTEIRFRFPCIFGGRIPFPCGEVQSTGFGALVGKDGFDFIFFFVIDNIRGWIGKGKTMCFCGAIRR